MCVSEIALVICQLTRAARDAECVTLRRCSGGTDQDVSNYLTPPLSSRTRQKGKRANVEDIQHREEHA